MMRRRELAGGLLFTAGGVAAVTGGGAAGGSSSGYLRTPAEIASGVIPLNPIYPPGVPDRYGNNVVPGETDMTSALAASMAQAVVLGGSTVSITGLYRIASSLTIPAAADVVCRSGGLSLDAGVVLKILGRFTASRIECFRGEGVPVFAVGSVTALYPEWFGAAGDAAIDGSRGTPSTVGFLRTIDAATQFGARPAAIHAISLGSGNYLVGQIVLPPATTIRGTGRQTTNIVCAPGTAGDWWTDRGDAAKIILEDLAMYAHGEPGLTAGIRLGFGREPHGSEGYINRLWVRDVPQGPAIAIRGNVGLYDSLTAYNSFTNLIIGGSANVCRGLISLGALGQYGVWLGGCTVSGLEIEANASGTVPLHLESNVSIQGLTISLAPGTEFDHLWEIGNHASNWIIGNLAYDVKLPVTVVGGNAKRADGTYFAGNISGPPGTPTGQGSYSSESAGQRLQSFTLRIANVGGTLMHRITGPSGSATNFSSAFRGASSAFTVTPNGPDGSSAFAAGGKIGFASPSVFWLDTPPQRVADALGLAVVSLNTTGVPLNVVGAIAPIEIAGVAHPRLLLQVTHALTGGAVPLNSTTFGPEGVLQFSWQGWLSA
jgi:hypothetical protein